MDRDQSRCALYDLQGLLSLAYTEGCLAESTDRLFSAREDARLEAPGLEAPAEGRGEIRRALEVCRRRENAEEVRWACLFHTPSVAVDEQGTGAQVCWDCYAYRIDRKRRTGRLCTARFAASCLQEAGEWRFHQVRWELMQRFLPQTYADGQRPEHAAGPQGAAPGEAHLDAADHLEVRNLCSLLTLRNWERAEELFAPSATLYAQGLTDCELCGREEIGAFCAGIRRWEAEHAGRYRCLQLLGPGCISAAGPGEARGVWLSETFEVRPDEAAGQTTLRRICRVELRFGREAQSWKIRTYRMRTLFELPLLSGASPLYQRMNRVPNWLPLNTQLRSCRPAPCFEAETLFALWPASLRRGELMNFLRRHMSGDGVTCRLSIRSRGPESPDLVGFDEIASKLQGMDEIAMPDLPSYHCAAAPFLVSSDDGETVWASWMDHSLTNMSVALGASGEDGTVPYMIFVSRYDHVFRKIGGKWYLTEFGWEPGLGLPNWACDPAEEIGWDRERQGRKYPLPGVSAEE